MIKKKELKKTLSTKILGKAGCYFFFFNTPTNSNFSLKKSPKRFDKKFLLQQTGCNNIFFGEFFVYETLTQEDLQKTLFAIQKKTFIPFCLLSHKNFFLPTQTKFLSSSTVSRQFFSLMFFFRKFYTLLNFLVKKPIC